MTTAKTFTVKEAIQASKNIEGLQAMTLETLTALHSTLTSSSDKQAAKRADLVGGIINAAKKELKAVVKTAAPQAEQMELIPVENSVKPKAPRKPKAAAKTAAPKAEAAEETPEEPKAPKKPVKAKTPKAAPKAETEEKAPEAPKAPKTLKRKKKETVDLDAMTPAQLKAHIKSLEAKTEDFPETVSGTNSTYVRTEFETIKDLQMQLLENPMRTFMFVDEKQDDELTQFLVLFASPEVIVLLDRNRQKNSTVNLNPDKLEAETVQFDKIKFKYSFYSRQK